MLFSVCPPPAHLPEVLSSCLLLPRHEEGSSQIDRVLLLCACALTTEIRSGSHARNGERYRSLRRLQGLSHRKGGRKGFIFIFM